VVISQFSGNMGFERIMLGRTGVKASRLGIASGYGADGAMVEEAVAWGVNYLYWGAWRSKRMAAGIKRVVQRNREDLIIVVHSSARSKSSLDRVIQKSMKRLGVDHLDVLLLSMGGSKIKPSQRLMEHAFELKDRGLVSFLAVSSHNRLVFREFEEQKLFDIFHIRYNAAHRGAEKQVFDTLPQEGGPGVVSFTNTRWGSLLNPANMPPGESTPTPTDCYRFVLSHPKVHVAVCAPNSMRQLRENLRILEMGPMSEEEMDRMRHIGDHVYKNESSLKAMLKSINSISWRRKSSGL
jgi:predicted aldo/keto reductase-like oxidoreductase